MDNVKILEVKQSIFAANDEQAAQLRQSLKEKKIFLLNLMSAPGSGKTTTLRSTIAALKDELRIGVMEADIDSDVDAKAIAAAGAKAIQLHTGGMCHLDGAARQVPRCLPGAVLAQARALRRGAESQRSAGRGPRRVRTRGAGGTVRVRGRAGRPACAPLRGVVACDVPGPARSTVRRRSRRTARRLVAGLVA